MIKFNEELLGRIRAAKWMLRIQGKIIRAKLAPGIQSSVYPDGRRIGV